ncbi:MAG: type I restriction endonuclease subunit R, partial [Thermoguttaceae bacterium]|nr:type I restriction endonuclease subunit R [Thermoguttaceae bacterium]
MSFTSEKAFEDALIEALTTKYGWDSGVIEYPSEEELIGNWARILFENNRGRDALNEVPLTKGEIDQILEQIRELRDPCRLNGFVNGKEVRIKRDAKEDSAHFGKEVALKIYDRNEIAGGKSRYQIVRQPRFSRNVSGAPHLRGDLTLLINGMPLIHIELKRSGVPLSAPCNQIQYYSDQGAFSGLFSLVQIFVAMTPEETVYFANPGPDGKFDKNYFFHWADSNNERVDSWNSIAQYLLSIPMAHQLVGFYSVADAADGTLKVMRSYQYYAASGISTIVSKRDWNLADPELQRGGYVWHTTGSGKTLTSFKSAQLVKESGDADKVVFLMDRIELGTQSLREYRAFADADVDVQDTADSFALLTKLKSSKQSDKLIVTSIQKASLLRNVKGVNDADFEALDKKRIVFIVDECHRSTFGDMLMAIKENFPRAMFFGFSGTPILEDNEKKHSTTADVFGTEIHRYSVADGIRDKNVLGFDHYKVLTYQDKDLKNEVALHEAKANSVEEALADPKKKTVFYQWLHAPMPRTSKVDGKLVHGVESRIPVAQYSDDRQGAKHREKVVDDIVANWTVLSVGKKFHAIFATSSIVEAIKYYRLFKEKAPELKVTALFDPNVNYSDKEVADDSDDESGQLDYGGVDDTDEKKKLYATFKTEGIREILDDYGKTFKRYYSLDQHAFFKRDLTSRLAHKDRYIGIERKPEELLDLVVVVDQLLTGYDSKWINVV